jgi:Fur family transcriptional regulator, zinc uptake regulator
MEDHCQACDRSEIAARALAAEGERLTGLRREVLRALHHAPRPLGAYDLFNQLKSEGHASAPPAVYRVLDFLVEKGLAHKLPSLSAYAACQSRPHHAESCFLICEKCGQLSEIEFPFAESLKSAAGDAGFVLTSVSVEARGICRACNSQ